MRSRETKRLKSENSNHINNAFVEFSIKGVRKKEMVAGGLHSQERDSLR